METALTEDEILQLRNSLIAENAHNQKCARNDCQICNVDERTDIEKAARKMGYPRGTWPEDLAQVLTATGQTMDGLLALDADQLAEIFDRTTSSEVPVGFTATRNVEKHYEAGRPDLQVIVKQLTATDETRTVKRWRPPSPSELESKKVADQLAEDERQVEADEARLRRLAEKLDQADKELQEARQEVEGRGHHAFRRQVGP